MTDPKQTAPAHTAGKLVLDGACLCSANGNIIGVAYGENENGTSNCEANAARFLLCWNDHDALKAHIRNLECTVFNAQEALGEADKEHDALVARQDALKAAFSELLKMATGLHDSIAKEIGSIESFQWALDRARAALALCEKGGVE